MRQRGEITLFLAMILLSICALLCVVAESARTAGARCFLRMAADSAMDSLMAQYHRGLWERYRILGLQHSGKGMLEEELKGFLLPYQKAENWYPLETDQVSATEIRLLTQGNGDYLEQEILDYMKYGLVGILWDELNGEESQKLLEDFKEAESVSQVSDLYEGHSREAVRLEQAIEDINESLQKQEEHWREAEEALEDLDGGSFIWHAEEIIRALEQILGQVAVYEARADILAGKLAESRNRFEAMEDLREETRAGLEDEIRQYEAYTSEDGARRREIVGLRERSADQIGFVREMIEEAEDVIEYIADWEPDDEDDELDEEALWRPVRRRWARRERLALAVSFGVKDKEKQGFLETVKNIAGSGLLGLVLPEGASASDQLLELTGAPSRDALQEEPEGWKGGVEHLLDRLLVCEYDVRFFNCFARESSKEGGYELEYILYGNEREKDNLAAAAASILLLREGMNLLHIMSDAGKRQEARTLAATIAGGTGLLPLVAVLTFFVLAGWALGEAVVDVRRLLEGGSVPLIKTAQDWRLGLQGLLDMGKTKGIPGEIGQGSSEKGLDYRGYLRVLLFGGYGDTTVYRMMDMMQMNLRREEKEFLMADCACAVDMELTVWGKHVFFSLGLWKNGGNRTAYETRMAVSGSYMGDL